MISIIIPCYNAERFLRQMLDSVVGQTYTDWELICVNDGSTDDTETILTQYARMDSRIRYIGQNNAGVSTARNVALDTVQGDYVYFADADDILESNALQVLIDATIRNNATLTRADYTPIDYANRNLYVNKLFFIRKKYADKQLDAFEFQKKIIRQEYFLWTCIFQKDIIEKFHIRFLPKCQFMEDAMFIVEYLMHSNKNVYVNEYIYNYRKYDGSITDVCKDFSSDLQIIKTNLDNLENNEITKSLRSRINDALIKHQNSTICKFRLTVAQTIAKISTFIEYKLSKKELWITD